MILKSAKDLGAPGVDEVYGVGLLDIQASQSPLSFNSLVWFVPAGDNTYVTQTVAQVIQTYNTEKQKTFDAQGFYYYAYEPVGQTFRDFAIPLTDKLVGQTFTAASGYQAYFQAYLLGRMDAWVKTQGFVDATRTGGVYPMGQAFGGDMTLSMAPRASGFGFRDTGPAYQTAIAIEGGRSKVAFGFGDGAVALGGSGFGLASDYDAERGGANPLLGLASGGGYASFGYQVAKGVTLSTGLTSRDERRESFGQRALEDRGSGARTYKAAAQHVSLDWQAASRLKLTGAYTVLHEDSALLGVQSLDASDLRHGSTTEGFTVAASWDLSPRLSLAAAGTTARTQAADRQNITVADGGLASQAFQVSLTGRGVLRSGDAMRLTLAQPMYVRSGGLELKTVEIVDRTTGALGIVSRELDVSQPPTYSAELLYSAPVLDNRSDVAFFGRVETSSEPAAGGLRSYMAGARVRFGF
jgi:hypothetical protein